MTTTPMRYHTAELDLYRNATLIGTTMHVTMSWPAHNSFEIRVPADPSGYYRVILDPATAPEDDEQYDGWTFARAMLEINGGGLHGSARPLSWYTAEPTDWPSGIVRWHFPALPGGAVRGTPVAPCPPCTYSLLIRRPA